MLLERPVKEDRLSDYYFLRPWFGGSYNSSIIKAVQQMFEDHADKSEIVVLAIGSLLPSFVRGENGYYVAKEMRHFGPTNLR